MKMFVYGLREYDEREFFETYTKKYGVEYASTSEKPTLDNTNYVDGFDAVNILTSPVDSKLLDIFKSKGVKCIATRTIGYDHIDYQYAEKIGMGVVHITYSPDTVADYTVMMMLMGLRKVKYINQRAAVQDYSLEGKLARELPKCTVGIIGTGRIGETVIRDLSGFGCKILAYDPYKKDSVKKYAQYVDLETIITQSDIISLHAPATSENYHMLNDEAFNKMKTGVGIVNCARGTLVDSTSLINSIENGKVGFACLDVIEDEYDLYYFNRMGVPINNPQMAVLKSFPNVIVMPHMAFYTDEAVSNMVENSITEILRYFNK